MKLKRGESIVTAYAERAAGPGWSNAPVWVIVRGADGTLRQECLQPDEQSAAVVDLYAWSALAHQRMTQAVAWPLRHRRSVVGLRDD